MREFSSEKASGTRADAYDPFARGRFPVGVRTIQAPDTVRGRVFPCETWYPADAQHKGQDLASDTQDAFHSYLCDGPRRQMALRDVAAAPGPHPLVVFSHGSAADGRRMSTFLCTHLASHGYVVAALDHFELVAEEWSRSDSDTAERKAARGAAWIANRVPDVRFLLDHLFGDVALGPTIELDQTRIGIVGYSFGGWTALAATAVEPRIRAVVALAPGGSSKPKPGILPAQLTFDWGRDVPTMYLIAENDCMTPLDGMYELFERTRATKQMVILRRADHLHFLDEAERQHETARTMPWTGELAWIPKEMLPIAELCSEDGAHAFVRGLAVSHFDAVLKGQERAKRFLAGDLVAELTIRGIDAMANEG